MSGPRVALTFDAEHPDRPTVPGVTESILDSLARESARSTFFLQGRWVEAYPRTARRIAADGHLIGNHSHYHTRMPLLSERGFGIDMRAAERVIRRITGADPAPWFRIPFGASAGHRRTNRLIAAAGYLEVGWDVDSGDWHVRLSAAKLERETLAGVDTAGDSVIVLFHGWPHITARALPGILAGLRDRRARLVTVDDVM